MVLEDTQKKVLEYLKKHDQANTFRLATELDVERPKILNIIKKLEEKGAVELKTGKVRFLKFPSKEKKARIEVKKAPSKAKTKQIAEKTVRKKALAKHKLGVTKKLQAENEMLRERVSELEASIKRHYTCKAKQFREQDEHIEKLEKTVKALQQKAEAPPKIIYKTIVKKIIKKVPCKAKEKIKPKKIELPKFNIDWIKSVQQVKMPKFIEQKISMGKPKINLAGLNKNIQQLHVPKFLKHT